MPSSFFGLEIGYSALASSQIALDVVSNNVSNINTPGYARETVAFDETVPFTLPGLDSFSPGQLGTGTTITAINEVRDQFLDRQILAANSDQSAYNTLQQVLGQAQTAFSEPSSSGIGQQLTNFFNAFSNLAANPEDPGIRATVVNQAITLTNAFHNVSNSLSQLLPNLSSRIQLDVQQLNNITTQIATLNHQIGVSIAAGQHPNDLIDKRSALLSQLSGLVNLQIVDEINPQTGQPNGEIDVHVGGFTLVQGDTAEPLSYTSTSVGSANTLGLMDAQGNAIPLLGGEVYGLLKASAMVKGYQSQLDTLAYNLINAVNNIHQTGMGLDGSTGTLFFSSPPPPPGTGAAASISVNSAIIADPQKIAAASVPTPPNPLAPGNGDVASQIANLANTAVIGGATLNDYYNALISTIGSDTQTAQSQANNQQQIVSQLQSQQQSVSGVNLDEELTNMLQYQRTYQAAARVINMADTFLNTIINGLGAGSTSVAA
ncbi:MAG TPA: flagellar hook-associated protein FlgK [Chthonomonas sp.]|uniref:flagellar hook-associated protein FlgK n=1 Tax=Chthonomonas sp. TaxID=2282153 RepID=UPI002B4B22C2|nr:flagellar hook-associated protein FlgK [Chthonomonas sp.]HLH81606.1 flagellar hook-associated protein FlgK [Chthonomonas sp.]